MQPIKTQARKGFGIGFQWSAAWSSVVVVVCAAGSGQGAIFSQKNRKFVKGLENLGILQLGLRFSIIAYSLCGQPGTSDGTLLVERQAWLALIEWASELIDWRLRPCLFYVAVQLP